MDDLVILLGSDADEIVGVIETLAHGGGVSPARIQRVEQLLAHV